MPSYRITFRSNTRQPTTIFTEGFTSQFSGPIKFIARPNCSGDMMVNFQ